MSESISIPTDVKGWALKVEPTIHYRGPGAIRVAVPMFFTDEGKPKAVVVSLEDWRDGQGVIHPAGTVAIVSVEHLVGTF